MINQDKLKQENPFMDISGQEIVKQNLKSALLANRHVLIVGAPGTGKTTLAKNIAMLLPEIEVSNCSYNCLPSDPICPECRNKKPITKKIKGLQRFVRVQGSPDLTVEDLLGDIDPIKALKFGPLSMEAFSPGKIFKANNGVLFFDELNRCPEKLQNALLQVLEERKATIGSYDVDIPARFIFVATMNPSDSSTEKLSDVLLDRFDVIYMNYPESTEIEMEIVKGNSRKLEIDFSEDILQQMVLFVRLLREDNKLEKVPGVRATIGLYERASANAILVKKQKVDFSDVFNAITSVLSHRIKLKPSIEYLKSAEEYIKEKLEKFAKDNDLDTPEKGDSP